MKGVILDKSSFDRGDVSLTRLLEFPVDWTNYASTCAEQTRDRIRDCNVVITNKIVLDRDILESASSLQLILIAATGTDNVDLPTCRERGITVCNVRHYATPAVVQHTIALMLNLLTNQIKYHADVVAGAWSKSDVFCLLEHPIIEAEGKVLGIIGYGTLGKRVAEIANALGMSVRICQRPGGAMVPDRVPFDQLLADADVLTLHCPLTDATTRLLGKHEFRRMKPSAVVINTARGAIIDADALVDALKQGEIAGAGIDVLDHEPPPETHPLLQKGIPNLIVTPHNAWGTRESRQRLVDQLSTNLGAWINSNPVNIVD
jgi:glycerate dehydrogenase